MQKLFFILKKYDYVFLFLTLVIVSIVLISRSTYFQQSRLGVACNAVAGGWYQGVNSIGEYFGLKAENDRLAAENARLRANMAESYIAYSDSIFVVNDTTYRQRYSYTEATVVKKSWSQQNNFIMIDKGSHQGIETDMAVISPEGIVGIVVATTANFATVMPVLHSDSRNSVKVKRTGISGSLVWDGKDFRYAQVIKVPTTHKFEENDTIVTSGDANDFPEGIPVGYVTQATPEKGSGFYHLTIRLATDFNKLSHVYVINNRFRDEQKELTRKTNSTI